jgi:4-hydroxy-tetrahydrodipicolinate reductase
MIQHASDVIPIFHSGNMSLGINLLIELSKTAAKVLGNAFDIEIIEMHHNQKIDAPSGTALMIAYELSSVREEESRYTYDRHSQRKKRDPAEIGIHSVRAGTIVGEHEVIFAGSHEVVTLKHSAQSKEIFANGALNAARFLVGQSAGLYDMSDLLKKQEE